MIIRESVLGRALWGSYAFLAATFAMWLVNFGDQLTSKQWVYLMSVPGGKWAWTTLFGASAAFVLFGYIYAWWPLSALGHFGIGSGCSGIVVFYSLAPQLDAGLLTAGWFPWLICALLAYFGAAVTLKPVVWF